MYCCLLHALLQVPGYERGNFLGPTLLGGVTTAMDVWSEEIFGPVLVCLEVGNPVKTSPKLLCVWCMHGGKPTGGVTCSAVGWCWCCFSRPCVTTVLGLCWTWAGATVMQGSTWLPACTAASCLRGCLPHMLRVCTAADLDCCLPQLLPA